MALAQNQDVRRTDLRNALAALSAGRFEEAARLSGPYVRGVADIEAALLRALSLGASGHLDEAAPLLDAIACARPSYVHPVHDLVGLLRGKERLDDAVAAVRAVLAIRPGQPRLGGLLAELGDLTGAITCFEAVTSARPDDPAAWTNLGKALAAEGRMAEALAAHDRAVALTAKPQLRLNRAMSLLKAGRLTEGVAAWQCRHELPGARALPPGPRLAPADPVAGRTVLLAHEQGFGDTIMLIRYAACLAERGARVVAWVPPVLVRLVASVPGVTEAVPMSAPPPPSDAVVPMIDLLAFFGDGPASIPNGVPYLRADPAAAGLWHGRLAGRPGFRVGLVWAGAARDHDPAARATDRLRSLDPALLAPLLAVPGIMPVSLQFGASAPPGVLDGLGAARDFLDTAAIIEALDLVVSVDTAVAHLAGALGKPVLLLDRYDNCWRWFHGREDTPWYPTMRIVRQERAGDWPPVIARAAAVVAGLANGSP